MAPLTDSFEPEQQKKRHSYRISTTRYCAYHASNHDHQCLQIRNQSVKQTVTRHRLFTGSRRDQSKTARTELDSRILKADPTSDHLFTRLTAAPDPPSICPDLVPPRSEQPLATVKLTRDSKYVAEGWNEDAQQHKWSRQDFFQHFGDIDRSFKLTGFTHAGEFIYVPKRVSRSFNILLCDPVRNSWRRFEFKGLANEVSVHNGVEEDDDDDDDDDDEYRPYELDAFPNHIDSQMSL
ncbi:BnaCnng47220D [Brassica napus]|uniref:F-box associated beta-propeller type 3 domain-containing protein n=2 Tax=Brassica TaxID=3705 RepID=A0A0D3D3B8_BRAOL|nr:unnamed protein product [Brassica napus]CDY65481.1 BnaCnng47220D [Brassica napus]